MNLIPCNYTGFQVKKTKVREGDIKSVMCKFKKLEIYDSINKIGSSKGAYIIVSNDRLNSENRELKN